MMTAWLTNDIAYSRIAVQKEFEVQTTLSCAFDGTFKVVRAQTNRKTGTDPRTQMVSDYDFLRVSDFFGKREKDAFQFYNECVAEMTRVFGNGRMHFHQEAL